MLMAPAGIYVIAGIFVERTHIDLFVGRPCDHPGVMAIIAILGLIMALLEIVFIRVVGLACGLGEHRSR